MYLRIYIELFCLCRYTFFRSCVRDNDCVYTRILYGGRVYGGRMREMKWTQM